MEEGFKQPKTPYEWILSMTSAQQDINTVVKTLQEANNVLKLGLEDHPEISIPTIKAKLAKMQEKLDSAESTFNQVEEAQVEGIDLENLKKTFPKIEKIRQSINELLIIEE